MIKNTFVIFFSFVFLIGPLLPSAQVFFFGGRRVYFLSRGFLEGRPGIHASCIRHQRQLHDAGLVSSPPGRFLSFCDTHASAAWIGCGAKQTWKPMASDALVSRALSWTYELSFAVSRQQTLLVPSLLLKEEALKEIIRLPKKNPIGLVKNLSFWKKNGVPRTSEPYRSTSWAAKKNCSGWFTPTSPPPPARS